MGELRELYEYRFLDGSIRLEDAPLTDKSDDCRIEGCTVFREVLPGDNDPDFQYVASVEMALDRERAKNAKLVEAARDAANALTMACDLFEPDNLTMQSYLRNWTQRLKALREALNE